MSDLIPFDGALPAHIARHQPSGSLDPRPGLSTGGFAVLQIPGKNSWAIRYRGESIVLTDERNAPCSVLEVVIVGVADNISKKYYVSAGREEGRAPDCYSLNGVTPDDGSPNKQSAVCQGCPQNKFGSRIGTGPTGTGSRAKACSDRLRLAVVPLDDIMNESVDGPMLLDLPTMSAVNFNRYASWLQGKGVPDVWWVGTRLGFDQAMTYPQLTFHPLGYISDQQSERVIAVQEQAKEQINRMLNESGPMEPETGQTAFDNAIPGTPPAAMTRQQSATVTPLPTAQAQMTQQGQPFRAVAPAPARQPRQRLAAPATPPAPAPAGLEAAIEDLLDQPA